MVEIEKGMAFNGRKSLTPEKAAQEYIETSV
jgi:hypothetical protein